MEKQDIQGLLLRAHGKMTAVAYLMLKVTAAKEARQWISGLLPTLTDGLSKPAEGRTQLAFTHTGFQELGLNTVENAGFRAEFVQGMAAPYRGRLLGDLEQSAVEHWEWGNPETSQVDICLLLFAPDENQLQSRVAVTLASLSGVQLVTQLTSSFNPQGKEHFGFRDGIAQPIIPGLSKSGPTENTVPVGEFILGYDNAYFEQPDTPLIPATHDPTNLLPASIRGDGSKDFGRNGSYMVFRQLEQDVKGFWNFLQDAVQHENPEATAQECIYLGAKMVGRWPNGTPLTVNDQQELPDKEQENDFQFHATDLEGFKCPIGSHIRRSNPRDVLQGSKPEKALKVSNRHRILRRGRNYGPPLVATYQPSDFLSAQDDGAKRGLLFICFNANISRQFEFVQHTWNNNTKFERLYRDPDPILGATDSRNKGIENAFTIQAKPVRRKIRNIGRFVHMKGGAYFFMPGLQAIRYLAQL